MLYSSATLALRYIAMDETTTYKFYYTNNEQRTTINLIRPCVNRNTNALRSRVDFVKLKLNSIVIILRNIGQNAVLSLQSRVNTMSMSLYFYTNKRREYTGISL